MVRKIISTRLALVVLALTALLAVGARAAIERYYKIKHRTTGQMITAPGTIGVNATLVSGWTTTPAGRHLKTGDMMLSGQVSPDGKLFAFTNTGYTRHQLHIVDLATEKEIATFPVEQAWSGLAWGADGKRLYVSSGAGYANNAIHIFDRWDKEGFQEARAGFQLYGAAKDAIAVAALVTSKDGKTLYAVNNSDGFVYLLDTRSGRGLGRVKTGDHPISAALTKDGKTLYVANLGGAEVAIVDVSDPARPVVAATMATGPHPNDLVLSIDEQVLFVSCGNTNHVLALDVRARRQLESIQVALGPKAPAGSTPNSLALSPDGKALYAANADNNTVAVIDVEARGKSEVEGFLPTGWYPTLVRVTPDGKRIIVGSGKGVGTGQNKVRRPIDDVAPSVSFQHMGNNLNGLLSFVDTPDKKRLSAYTKQAYENSPYRDVLLESAETKAETVIPKKVGEKSPIEHVVYIMKENRTYDQVFGDLQQGNGDPSLTLFGRDVTPNQHALAEQFVLLDNLYCSGEVSQDGQPWTLSAYATEFTQRAWTLSYSRHGRLKATREASEQSTPYIWELAAARGLSVRTYGMGTRRGTDKVKAAWWESRPPGLESEPGRQRDYLRAERFIDEFRELDAQGKVPNLIVMSLGENHTSGTTPGAYTPKASVASNDVAVGKIVEAVTKSKVWAKAAIFIIEDDAQNGPDHVDSHRTAGLVISPYVKRKAVDSSMYATVSMLRTIELLLGLPPMTQHDAAAAPMVNSFTAKADLSGFTALPARLDLMSKNPAHGYGAVESARMDFSEYDRIDEDALNRILWHSIKGVGVPMPAPRRRALPTAQGLLRFADGDDE
ncbi:MAG: bifunctional YncE family protein/alkaline phosphatase family protein [Acidobacteria bacterium]|nr:bifunctional YncE family protein/alkaline phosphatase family protein [Acidobacteriota bacterium]